MPAIINNLSVDFTFTNSRSTRSTKTIDVSRGSIYGIDDIFNIKYFSKMTSSNKTELYVSTIKVEFKDKQNFILKRNEDIYSFADTKSKRRVLTAITNDSEVFGIRRKQSKLLRSIES